jgi:hypothetical protein
LEDGGLLEVSTLILKVGHGKVALRSQKLSFAHFVGCYAF